MGDNIWGVYRPSSTLDEILLFMEGYQLKGGYQNIYNYVMNHYHEGKPIKVHLILIDNKDELLELVQNIEHPYETNNVFFDLVLLDKANDKLLYYDSSAYNVADLLQSIISYKTSSVQREKKKKPVITYTLILLNILIFGLTAFVSGNVLDIDSRVLILFGAKYSKLINEGEYYRLFTAMFLHGGLVHISFNMYALKAVGPLIEDIYGKMKFTVIYVLGGLVSTLFSYLLSPGISVGASGAIFALLGSTLVFAFKMRRAIRKGFLSSIIQVIAINLILGFTVSNIDNYGHIGGLIGGILISLILPIPEKKK
jgi:rhomboid protease GluP